MTTDPSIQAAGDEQPASQPDDTGAEVVVPNQELVKELLDQMKLRYLVDDDGDVCAPWENFRTYFMFHGEDEQQTFAARTFYERTYSIDDRPRLLDAADDWNRRTLWPKVYSHTQDDGTVRLIGETQMLVGAGVSLNHFVRSTVGWVSAAIEFDGWLRKQPGMAVDTDQDEGPHDPGQDPA
ncbi:MAG TPA: YbjN domain-containing protein [Actinocatenispora sp.]